MAPGLPLERFPGLARVAGLAHGVTTRLGGESAGPYAALNVGRGCGDERAVVERNRRRVMRRLGFDRFETPRQVHGDVVCPLEGGARPPATGCDGLVLREPGTLVGVLGADCPGVLLVAPRERVLAVVHAGWRGVVARVVPGALALLTSRYGVAPSGLRVGIGPGVSVERYEVTTGVAARIRTAVGGEPDDAIVRPGRPGHALVDLRAALRAQLVRAGVSSVHIETHPACTYDDERFFSHRRDRGVTGRHALVAGWR